MKTVIAGGGKIGLNLAKAMIEKRNSVCVIERDMARSKSIANELGVEVICGDCSRVNVLENAGTKDCDCFMVVTGSDQDNIVASQLAKTYFHAKKVISRVSDPRNLETFRQLGIDFAVSSTEIITKMIEQEADLRSMHLLASISKGKGAICTLKLDQNTVHNNVALKDIEFPKDSLLISITRDDEFIIPNGSTKLLAGDEVICVSSNKSQKALTKILGEKRKK